jgi:L-histidine N-alpha-methyltransferase
MREMMLNATDVHLTAFAEDVRRSLQLTPRQLPSQYLYDPLGSALFNAICELPWYGITRAENRLLAAHRDEVFERLPDVTRIVELGPGDGSKLRTLVERVPAPLTAHLIDVSGEALNRATQTLADLEHIRTVVHTASFEDGLSTIAALPEDGRALVLFLGSNIGNFDRPTSEQLLRRIHRSVGADGALLVGADLVKPERDLLAAYDDPLGVSAAFNLNVLHRINRELGGSFDIAAFRHRAVWNAACSRMEMFVVATKAQRVRIDALDVDISFAAGDSIWTESSYKYTADGVIRQLDDAGFETIEQWIDAEGAFALSLAQAI